MVAVTNASGAAIAINKYDPYGRPDAGNLGRFQYTGQQWIGDAGLYYYKARFYHAGLGRFMQTDPIGYADGMNLYAYVGGDPINYSDPSGRRRSEPSETPPPVPICAQNEFDCIEVKGNRLDDPDIGLRNLLHAEFGATFRRGSLINIGRGYEPGPDIDEIVVRGIVPTGEVATSPQPNVWRFVSGGLAGSASEYFWGVGEELFGCLLECGPSVANSTVRGSARAVDEIVVVGSRTRAYLGSAGPVFGRGGAYGRGVGQNPGLLNRHFVRVGYGWNDNTRRQVFRGAIGHRGSPNHIHFDILPPGQIGIGGTIRGRSFDLHPFAGGGG